MMPVPTRVAIGAKAAAHVLLIRPATFDAAVGMSAPADRWSMCCETGTFLPFEARGAQTMRSMLSIGPTALGALVEGATPANDWFRAYLAKPAFCLAIPHIVDRRT
jgi:hypothetical protein